MNSKEIAEGLQNFLSLEKKIIGITLLKGGRYDVNVSHLRFCEALVRGVNGESMVFEGSMSLCPSSDVALGFTQPKYVDISPRVKRKTKRILIAPLDCWDFKEKPEVALVICEPSQAMQVTIALGENLSTVDGQIAVCGLTSHTINEHESCLSLLCNSCRLYAGVKPNELGLAFPFSRLSGLWENIKKIGKISPKIQLDEHEITPSSRLILQILEERGRSTQKELIKVSGLSERSVRNSLKQLRKKDIIIQKSDISDMRAKVYSIKP